MNTREETLDYLHQKAKLTEGVYNAQNCLRDAYNLRKSMEGKSKKENIFFAFYFLFAYAVSYTLISIIFSGKLGLILALFGPLWVNYKFGVLQYRNEQKNKVNDYVQKAEQYLREEENNPSYRNGINGFPEEYYDYLTIQVFIKYVKEGRATTLQELYSYADTKEYRNKKLSLQTESNHVSKETRNYAAAAAAAAAASAINTKNIANRAKNIENIFRDR